MDTPNQIESVQPGKHYSLKADFKLNCWAFVAMVTSFAAHLLLPRHADWGAGLRAAISLAPLVPTLLYLRSIARFIRRMDELQRRIQLEACLFGATGTILFLTALSLLQGAGVLHAARLQHGLGWEGTFALNFLLYILGSIIANRRYQ